MLSSLKTIQTRPIQIKDYSLYSFTYSKDEYSLSIYVCWLAKAY